jgi:HD-like signal output (HDOD) protein
MTRATAPAQCEADYDRTSDALPTNNNDGQPVHPILTGVIAVGVFVLLWVAYRSRYRRTPQAPVVRDIAIPIEESAVPRAEIPFATETVATVTSECYRLAFGVPRLDYRIMGEHAEVLARIAKSIDGSVNERDYFPRRPLLLPKLLQALNDDESTRHELTQLILEDPSLAGSVLQRANSAFYRVAPEPIETLSRAVLLLGTDGLRSLVASAALQPVFRLPKGFFDSFANITWEYAQRSAAAAESFVKQTRSGDPFIAQLLGLLAALARIVLFRLTMDKYRESPNILPRAEVFAAAMQSHVTRVAHLIAASWKLSDTSLTALDEQIAATPPNNMSDLGRALYFGELCGGLALLIKHSRYSAAGAQAVLLEQGLDSETAQTLLAAAEAAGG